MRSSKKVLRNVLIVLLFVCVAVTINVLITLALEPYGTAAEVTWYDYRSSADEDIDTLIVGSSFAQRNADPYALDEALGSNSFSLSTPAQSFSNALASLETATEDHDLKRAIIFVGPESFQTEPWFNAQVTFLQAKSRGESIPKVLQNVGRLVFDEVNFASSKSITWMFPWCYSSVGYDVEAIQQNLDNRRNYPNPIDAASIVDPTWHYMGKGHGGYEGELIRDKMWLHELTFTTDAPFLDKNVADFTRLLDFAEEHGIELYVGLAPRPEFDNLAHKKDNYPKLMAGLEKLVKDHGGVYYDFNMTRRDFYHAEEDGFSDSQHLNIEGGKSLCTALGKLIKEEESGGNTKAHFYAYDKWDEYLSSDCFDPVEYAHFTYKINHDTGYVEITAHSIAQPGVTVEYEYEIDNPINGMYINVRPFDTDPTYHYPMHAGNGDVRMRLSVREKGTKKTIRTFYADIFY